MKKIVPMLCAVALAACAAAPQKPVVQKDALYLSLGGQAGVDRLAEATVRELVNDLRINLFFANGSMAESRRLLAEQLCAISGGPCTYTGRSMEEAHSGMYLVDADFDAFMQDFAAAMNAVTVPADAQRRLTALFEAMRPQIVGQ